MIISRLFVNLLLLSSLFCSAVYNKPILAADDEVKWSTVSIPADGIGGKWLLASGSDVRHLSRAADGTLYCYANPAGTPFRLFKSSDNGMSWSFTNKIEEDLIDIAVLPDKPNVIYCASSSKIYKSIDAGANFTLAGLNPGGAGAGNIAISSLDVQSIPGVGTVIVAGTRDTDAAQFGGVYLLEEYKSLDWLNTGLIGYDVLSIAFSPSYAHDRQMVAIATDETNTIVTANNNQTGWNVSVGDALFPGVAAVSAAISFPADYNSEVVNNKYVQFVGVDSGTGAGDVYQIDGKPAPANSRIKDLNAGAPSGLNTLDITSLSVIGNADKALIMAGASATSQIYLSNDSGKNWSVSTKQPTGSGKTYVLMPGDFSENGTAYAATGGTESAFSSTRDNGMTWNQVSLIDTTVTNIVDMAASPVYAQDNTLFLITFGGKNSLWRSVDAGASWQRVCSSTLPGVDDMSLVILSPQYSSNRTIFMVGNTGGTPALWKSIDNGQSFTRFTSRDPDTGAALGIDVWTIAPDNSLFVGGFNGTDSVVCRTTGGGLFYASKTVVGTAVLNSIVLSPTFNEDKTILAGNMAGWVYWSNDGGQSFKSLPYNTAVPPIGGLVSVAFDVNYSKNKTIYATGDSLDKGIFRFIIDKSTAWEKIDVTPPTGSRLTALAVSSDGTLYACNSQAVDSANKKGGMERSIDPNYALGPSFETITRGLAEGAALRKLYVSGRRLWSIDSTNIKLLTYTDTLATPVTPVSPANKSPGLDTRNVSIDWEGRTGTTNYKWQLNTNTDFSSVPPGFEGNVQATSAVLPPLQTETTYYWRVRATTPVLSPWSATWSFNTRLSTQVVAPMLTTPEAIERKATLKPVFQWTAIAGAERYELLVSPDILFASPLVAKTDGQALPSTAWQCDISLRYDTTYYWKVRAISGNNNSAWSAVGAFTTEPVPQPAANTSSPNTVVIPVPMPPQPGPVQTQTPPPAVAPLPGQAQQSVFGETTLLIYIGIGILLVLLILLVIVVILMLKVFRRDF